jgi:EAL domain-containing protein (putative c-di-GMP-specific phosphodiesterase class I)
MLKKSPWCFLKFANSGVKIALDDFGTRYSSLSYMSELLERDADRLSQSGSLIHYADSRRYETDAARAC